MICDKWVKKRFIIYLGKIVRFAFNLVGEVRYFRTKGGGGGFGRPKKEGKGGLSWV